VTATLGIPRPVLPADAPRAEWLEARRDGIGGSDMAALVGLHPYKTALHVYLDKTSDDPPDDTAGEAAFWGSVLEAPVAEHWARLHGKFLTEPGLVAHPDRPWMLVTVDRLVYPQSFSGLGRYDDGQLMPEAIYEGKTASAWKRDDWDGDRVPDHYQAQCQWEMAVWGLPRVHIGCLLGGQRFIEATVERDQQVIDGLITVGAEFWQRVIHRDPPSLEGEPVGPALDLLHRIHGTDNGEVVDLGDAGLEALVDYLAAKDAERAAKAEADAAKVRLWELLGDATTGQVDDVDVVRFATEPRAGHTVAPSIPRVLRPKPKDLARVLAGRQTERTEA